MTAARIRVRGGASPDELAAVLAVLVGTSAAGGPRTVDRYAFWRVQRQRVLYGRA